MASKARLAFDKNTFDIKRLLDLHEQEGGPKRGRRYGLAVLNKSAIVLITAYWEAYCEDIAAEGLKHLVKYSRTPDSVPVELKKCIAKDLKKDPHDLAVRSLSDRGWRGVLASRLGKLQEERNRRLNTPKSENIDGLFLSALGIERISECWHWATKMTPKRARVKLDKYVTLRGEIAHRGTAARSVTKSQVVDYLTFINHLASKTGGRVYGHVGKPTRRPLWKIG